MHFLLHRSTAPEVITTPAVTSGGKAWNDDGENCLLQHRRVDTEDQETGNVRLWLQQKKAQDCYLVCQISVTPILVTFSI